ncbi:MAG: hypothetical protein H6727_16935 [Myxococcales bacterium]|nr:hypothetical protein [Myxococcales bacterium]
MMKIFSRKKTPSVKTSEPAPKPSKSSKAKKKEAVGGASGNSFSAGKKEPAINLSSPSPSSPSPAGMPAGSVKGHSFAHQGAGVKDLRPVENLQSAGHAEFLGETPHLLSPPSHREKIAYDQEGADKAAEMKAKQKPGTGVEVPIPHKPDYPLEVTSHKPDDMFEKPLLVYKKNDEANSFLDVKSSAPSGALFGTQGAAMGISTSPADKGVMYLPDRENHISAMTLNPQKHSGGEPLFLTGPFNGCDFAAVKGPNEGDVTVFHSHFKNDFKSRVPDPGGDRGYNDFKQEAFEEAKMRMGIPKDAEGFYMPSKKYLSDSDGNGNNAEAFVYGRKNEEGKMEFFLHATKVEKKDGVTQTVPHIPSESLGAL